MPVRCETIFKNGWCILKRNKKIVLLAHCLLNINAKVYGIATEPAGCPQIVSGLLKHGYGIIQLPCVEQSCFGINRWGLVKEQTDFPAFRLKCRALLQPIVEQVLDFYENGYEIAAVIGLDGSPSCGVHFTCSGKWGGEIGCLNDIDGIIASLKTLNEPGVMMEVLEEMFEENKLKIRFMAADENDPEAAAEKLIGQLMESGMAI
jgi:predicted secreted protein